MSKNIIARWIDKLLGRSDIQKLPPNAIPKPQGSQIIKPSSQKLSDSSSIETKDVNKGER